MDGRLANVVGALLVSGIVVAIAALLSLLVRLIFKRRIGTSNYYIGALFLGGALYSGLLAVLTHHAPTARIQTATESRDTPTAFGLDSPFIAPSESQLETFPAQLDTAIANLSASDKEAALDALLFLQFSTLGVLSEKNPAEFKKMSERDIAAKHLQRLYRFTKSYGSSMTLRRYIELADMFKTKHPQWLEDFNKSQEVRDIKATIK
jgi:hypothetical protein